MSRFKPGAFYRANNRLKSKEAFQDIFSSGQRTVDKQFVFLAKKNNCGCPRLGLAVPKRHIHSSVKRNRIKRIIRESFRIKQKQFNGFDLVVLIRGPIKNLTKARFDMVLDKNWQKFNANINY